MIIAEILLAASNKAVYLNYEIKKKTQQYIIYQVFFLVKIQVNFSQFIQLEGKMLQ